MFEKLGEDGKEVIDWLKKLSGDTRSFYDNDFKESVNMVIRGINAINPGKDIPLLNDHTGFAAGSADSDIRKRDKRLNQAGAIGGFVGRIGAAQLGKG